MNNDQWFLNLELNSLRYIPKLLIFKTFYKFLLINFSCCDISTKLSFFRFKYDLIILII